VLLLALEQLVTSGLPLLTADNLVVRHRARLLQVRGVVGGGLPLFQ
jgi:hypothetical protein